MENKLIFDLGIHHCEDVDFYLSKGYRVIGLDADINSIDYAKDKYSSFSNQDYFIPLNYALSDKDYNEVSFFISQNSLWNSLEFEISNRNNLFLEERKVITRTLSSLFNEFGVPYYCKIDIEGYDNVCLKSLKGLSSLPKFISVESECVGDQGYLTEEEAQDTLNSLYELGYDRFKLIDQSTLYVLDEKRNFYLNNNMFLYKMKKYIKYIRLIRNEIRLKNKFKYAFKTGSSGPFGKDLAGVWMNYEQAVATLKKHRKDYFQLQFAKNYGFWCDWHACKHRDI